MSMSRKFHEMTIIKAKISYIKKKKAHLLNHIMFY